MKSFTAYIKAVAAILVIALTLTISGCRADGKSSDEQKAEGMMRTVCTKDGVDEFMEAWGDPELTGLNSGYAFNAEHCFNVTPARVYELTGVRVFKFSDCCDSFAFADGKICQICSSFGGFGFLDAVPWDHDGDGEYDLIVTSSWGSGIHRAELSFFDVKKMESTVIATSLDFEASPDNCDWWLDTPTPSWSGAPYEPAITVYSVTEIMPVNGNLADLAFSVTEQIGWISFESGTPELREMISRN